MHLFLDLFACTVSVHLLKGKCVCVCCFAQELTGVIEMDRNGLNQKEAQCVLGVDQYTFFRADVNC